MSAINPKHLDPTYTIYKTEYGLLSYKQVTSSHTYISLIFVQRLHRNKGIGTDLLLKAIDLATTPYIFLEASGTNEESLISWYEKHNFKVLSVEDSQKLSQETNIELNIDRFMIYHKEIKK